MEVILVNLVIKLAISRHRKTLSGNSIKQLSLVEIMATSTLGEGSRHEEHFYKADLDVATLETFQRILDSVELDLKEFCDDMGYQGFDKTKMAKLAGKNLGAFLTVKFCVLGAMRGTNLEKILDKSVNPDADIAKAHKEKKIVSKVAGPNTLTVGRLLATFPEIAAYYMLKLDIPAKLTSSTCPPSLQFPAAAGLPMSHDVRLQHLEFSVQFSFLISKDKKFWPVYYLAAFNGQSDPKRLNKRLRKVVGDPSMADSKSVNLYAMISSMVDKYGAERFDMKNYSPTT